MASHTDYMAASRKSKQQQKTQETLAILIAGVACLTISIYLFGIGNYSLGLLFFAPVTFGAFWILAVEVETRCGVITKTTGRPCRNVTYGLLFGCSASHHHLGKFLTRIGVQKRALATAQQGSGQAFTNVMQPSITGNPSGKAAAPILVKIDEDKKAKVGYWLMVITSVATVVSTVTGLATLH